MKVKIICCLSPFSWYGYKIGEIVEVLDYDDMYYKLPCTTPESYFIKKEDCKMIEDNLDKITGLTNQEKIVMDKICDGYNEFLKLEKQHPSEQPDFASAIHLIQNILAMRIVRRNYPEYWLIHNDKK